jgi:hypothetical protein
LKDGGFQHLYPVRSEILPKYFISVVNEISDRKQAETELQQRAKELEWLNRLLTETTALLNLR